MIDPRHLFLTAPSLVVLALLVLHSLLALPGRRALAFWGSIAAYGLLRGAAVRFIASEGLAGSVPYVVRDPLLPILGVPLQEITGWAIVGYLAWWIGERFSKRLFAQILWGSLFLGAIAWAVESAAIAAGWWRWTVPRAGDALLGVPFIGLIDWFFVGSDFLLPFLALTAPALRRSPARFLTLAAFPAHFGAHLVVTPVAGFLPIPVFHLAHWVLLGTLLWLATRSGVTDTAYAAVPPGAARQLPAVGLWVVLVDLAIVLQWVAGSPAALPALLPAAVMAAGTARPVLLHAGAALALVLALRWPCFFLAAVPRAAAATIEWSRRRPRLAPVALVMVLVLSALVLHAQAARRHDDLVRRLDRAIAARDGNDLQGAVRELEKARREHPGAHVPAALLGEIEYRLGHLDAARKHFTEAVAIQPAGSDTLRRLSVVEARLGARADAARHAAQGLEIEPENEQLRYLAGGGSGASAEALLVRLESLGPDRAYALCSLAFEVGDTGVAALLLDAGRRRWPGTAAFYRGGVNLALTTGDETAARRIATDWRRALPDDVEAREAARRLGLEP